MACHIFYSRLVSPRDPLLSLCIILGVSSKVCSIYSGSLFPFYSPVPAICPCYAPRWTGAGGRVPLCFQRKKNRK